MEENYWHQKWEKNEIGFHESEANALLVRYFSHLAPPPGSRVFVPLCGKTRAIAWLLSNGYRVVGAELSQLAIEQLFTELEVEPERSTVGALVHFSAPDIDMLVGDIFEVSSPVLGTVAATFDRAALVALPAEIREHYAAHIMEITRQAPQLLITFDYDQGLMEGPPFSISTEELNRHFGKTHQLTLLESAEVPDGLKGKCPARENAWLVKPI